MHVNKDGDCELNCLRPFGTLYGTLVVHHGTQICINMNVEFVCVLSFLAGQASIITFFTWY